MTELTADAFRAVMGRFATGVTVMTTEAGEVPHGMTANAVSSVSLDPLLVLVCVERDTVMADMVVSSGRFALSILGRHQAGLSQRFADSDRPVGDAEFDDLAIRRAATGVPVLEDALGFVDCTVWATYDGGDHVIVVGEVAALAHGPGREALVYYRSRYMELCPPDDVA